jgi:hypothetical protein
MKLILTGHFKGQTIVLNGHKFVDGTLELKGDMDKMQGLINYFRSYNAYLAGSDELAKAEARDKENANGKNSNLENGGRKNSGRVQSDKPGSKVEASGSGNDGDEVGAGDGLVPEGDGVPEGREGDPQVLKIIDAVKSLDPDADEFWTDAGLPKVSAIEKAAGLVGVTRKEIENAMPGYNREKAIADRI